MSQFSRTVITTQNRRVEITEESRYRNTPLLLVNGVTEWGLWKSPAEISASGEHDRYQVREGEIGRLDLVSWNVYGTVIYAWCIAHANGFINPIRDMTAGQYIKVPKQSLIERYAQRKPRP